jgi:hypothetical protein
MIGKHYQLRGTVAENQNESERDCNRLKRTVSKNHRTTAAKVTTELSIHLEDPVSTKTV